MMTTNSGEDMRLNEIHEGQQEALCIGKSYDRFEASKPLPGWIVPTTNPRPQGSDWNPQIVSRLWDTIRWQLTWVFALRIYFFLSGP